MVLRPQLQALLSLMLAVVVLRLLLALMALEEQVAGLMVHIAVLPRPQQQPTQVAAVVEMALDMATVVRVVQGSS